MDLAMSAFTFSPACLRRAREAAGLRQEHVAVAVDRSVGSISGYESGQITPSATMVAALATAIGCNPGDLYETQTAVLA